MPSECFRLQKLEVGAENQTFEEALSPHAGQGEEERHLTSSPELEMVRDAGPWTPAGPLTQETGLDLPRHLQPHQHQPVDLTSHYKVHGELFPCRKQRRFIPDNKKDDCYWDRRRRNNEAAKRSRQKRRLNDMVLETRVLELTKENTMLRAELNSLRDKVSIQASDHVYKSNITGPPVLRNKLLSTLMPELHPENPPALSPPPPMGGGHPASSAFDPVPMETSPTHSEHSPNSSHLILSRALCMSPRPEVPSVYIQNTYADYIDIVRPVPSFPVLPSQTSPVDQESAGSTGSWSSEESGSPVSGSLNGSTSHFCLPHKLRHKHLLGLEVSTARHHTDNGSSTDSGITTGTDTPSPANSDAGSADDNVFQKCKPGRKLVKNFDLQAENLQLRTEMQRLSSEVATLKDMLLSSKEVEHCRANKAQQEVHRQSPVTTQSI